MLNLRIFSPELSIILKVDFLKNKKIVISAGPTYERIDPVRYIGNFSSGKMGYAIAEKCADAGAEVILVSGPVNIKTEHPRIELVKVESAREMYEACTSVFPQCDIGIMAAAVADYRPAEMSTKKIKKSENEMTIHLVKNPDILQELGRMKTPKQILVGFALETNNELEHAQAKLKRKNADLIVLNSMNDKGAGFRHDTNKITIILQNGRIFEFGLKNKEEVAQDLLQCISENFG